MIGEWSDSPSSTLVAGAVLESVDPAASAAFYAAVQAWRFEPTAGGALQGITSDGQHAALIVPADSHADGQGRWVPVFAVPGGPEGLAQAARAAALAGAQIQRSWLPGALRVTDPWGNVFALVAGEPTVDSMGTMPDWLSLVDVAVKGRKEPLAFYESVLGVDLVDSPGYSYVLLCRQQRPLAGLWFPESAVTDALWGPLGEGWAVYLSVSACDPIVALALELGAQLSVPTTDSPVGPFANLRDPLGATFGVSVRNSDADRIAHATSWQASEPLRP